MVRYPGSSSSMKLLLPLGLEGEDVLLLVRAPAVGAALSPSPTPPSPTSLAVPVEKAATAGTMGSREGARRLNTPTLSPPIGQPQAEVSVQSKQGDEVLRRQSSTAPHPRLHPEEGPEGTEG